jgi:hypothetical protein
MAWAVPPTPRFYARYSARSSITTFNLSAQNISQSMGEESGIYLGATLLFVFDNGYLRSAVHIDINGKCGRDRSMLVQQHKGRLYWPVCKATWSITKPMPTAVRTGIWKTYVMRRDDRGGYEEAGDDDPGANSYVFSHSAWPCCTLSKGSGRPQIVHKC